MAYRVLGLLMSGLTLIASAAPPPKLAVLLRAKARPLRRGLLRCKRCGSQTYARVVNGAIQGRRGPTGGTVIYACVCFDCLMGGITTAMIWDMESIASDPTPKGN
jgi:hypothetical protein